MTIEPAISRPVGAVLHSPILYDVIVWFALRGRERQLRERLLDLSELSRGESVLDVGCGTGNLTIRAKRRAGLSGAVCGADPSPEMLARARSKATRTGVEVRFENAAAQKLPFADASFDLALSSMMLHHLDRAARREFAAEMRRVVKPNGRVLVVDFAEPLARTRGLASHFRHRHGYVELPDIIGLLKSAGLLTIRSGAVGIGNTQFALARSPTGPNDYTGHADDAVIDGHQ